jgi:hypothetical protein
VLRGYLQPSVFGVFLLLSFYFVTKNKYAEAIIAIAPAAAIHANYLFLGGILTILYLIQARFEKKSMVAATILFMVVLPYSIYVLKNFFLLDAEIKTAIDQAVMACYESNLHVNPSNWINPKFFVQLVALVIGTMAVWNTRFLNLFLTISGTAIVLTVIAYALESAVLISLNPWRFSIVLIPVSIATILARVIRSGIWSSVRPFLIALFGSICAMLVYYRIFGNSSAEFLHQWIIIHLGFTLVLTIATLWLSKRDWYSKLLEFLLLVALFVVGVTDMYVEKATKQNSKQFQAISSVKRENEPKTIYVVPTNWTSFRLNARKAVYVDDNLVYGPALPGLIQRQKHHDSCSSSSVYTEIVNSFPMGTTIRVITPSTVFHQPQKKSKSSAE